MPLAIAVLEDDVRRRLEMQRQAADRFWMYDILFFDTPGSLCRWLERNRDRTLAISLDHDLNRIDDAVLPDDAEKNVGTGEDAARWLAERPPFCPVVIHTSNARGAAKMAKLLRKADWPVRQVEPTDDLDWVFRDWLAALQQSLTESARTLKPAVAVGSA